MATLVFLLVMVSLVFNRFRMRKQRQVALAEREKQLLEVEKVRAEENLKHADELLAAYLSTIKEKTALIENLDAELNQLKRSHQGVNGFEGMAANMEKLISILAAILTDEDWRRFRHLFDQVHPDLLYRLKERFPDLSAADFDEAKVTFP